MRTRRTAEKYRTRSPSRRNRRREKRRETDKHTELGKKTAFLLALYIIGTGLIYILMGHEFKPIKFLPTFMSEYRPQTLTAIALIGSLHIATIKFKKDKTALLDAIPMFALTLALLATLDGKAIPAIIGTPLLLILAAWTAHDAKGGTKKDREIAFAIICLITPLGIIVIALSTKATGHYEEGRLIETSAALSLLILIGIATTYKVLERITALVRKTAEGITEKQRNFKMKSTKG